MHVNYCDFEDTFLYLVAIGTPVVEVAVLLYKERKILDYVHLFINHYPALVQESIIEHPPITDFTGTRCEHGISELELEDFGVSLSKARSQLEHFINVNNINYPLFVNDFQRYHTLGISRLPNGWRPYRRGPQQVECPAHKSTYFKGKEEPLCALTLASTTFLYGDTPLKPNYETREYQQSAPSLSPLSQDEEEESEEEEEDK